MSKKQAEAKQAETKQVEGRAFVPTTRENRQETAILLVGTAEEYGIDKRQIKVESGGFDIPESLADLIFAESEGESSGKNKKTSGNRAAKNDSTKKE